MGKKPRFTPTEIIGVVVVACTLLLGSFVCGNLFAVSQRTKDCKAITYYGKVYCMVGKDYRIIDGELHRIKPTLPPPEPVGP